MKNFIIGFYFNEQGQQYATIVVKADDICDAVYMQRKTNNYKLFRPVEYISEISEKEIMDIKNDNDIYNQVEILVVPQSYKDECKKLIEQTLTNAVRFFPR